MRNKTWVYGTLLIAFLVFFMADTAAAKKQKIHPSFKQLLQMYPRANPIHAPEVPRISPRDALALYKTNQAVFIEIINDSGKSHGVYGAAALRFHDATKKSVVRKLKSIKKKYIVFFCK